MKEVLHYGVITAPFLISSIIGLKAIGLIGTIVSWILAFMIIGCLFYL